VKPCGSQPTLLNEAALACAATTAPVQMLMAPSRAAIRSARLRSATKPANVSLEQMLVLLVRNNPDAFSGKNMNRLKTGKILQLPTPDTAGISEAGRPQEVKVQARELACYKNNWRLRQASGQVPAEEPAQQAVSGKVGAAADAKAAPPADSEGSKEAVEERARRGRTLRRCR